MIVLGLCLILPQDKNDKSTLCISKGKCIKIFLKAHKYKITIDFSLHKNNNTIINSKTISNHQKTSFFFKKEEQILSVSIILKCGKRKKRNIQVLIRETGFLTTEKTHLYKHLTNFVISRTLMKGSCKHTCSLVDIYVAQFVRPITPFNSAIICNERLKKNRFVPVLGLISC